MKLTATVVFAFLLFSALADLHKDCQRVCAITTKCDGEKCKEYPDACMNACIVDKATTKTRWRGKKGCYKQCQWRYKHQKKTRTVDFPKCQKVCLEEEGGLEYAKHYQSCMKEGKCYNCKSYCRMRRDCLELCARLEGNDKPYWDCQREDSTETASCLQEAFDKAFKW